MYQYSKDLQSLNTVQGKLIKQSLGPTKHFHNTQLQLLETMSILRQLLILLQGTLLVQSQNLQGVKPDKDYEFLFDVFISFKCDSCTGENCEVWIFSNRTDAYPAL